MSARQIHKGGDRCAWQSELSRGWGEPGSGSFGVTLGFIVLTVGLVSLWQVSMSQKRLSLVLWFWPLLFLTPGSVLLNSWGLWKVSDFGTQRGFIFFFPISSSFSSSSPFFSSFLFLLPLPFFFSSSSSSSFMCVGDLSACMPVCHVYVWCSQRPGKGLVSSSARATDAREPPCRCWGSNLGPVEEQPVLLTVSHLSSPNVRTERSLGHLEHRGADQGHHMEGRREGESRHVPEPRPSLLPPPWNYSLLVTSCP